MMIRHFLTLFLIALSIPLALGQRRQPTSQKEEKPIMVAGVPVPKPVQLKKRIKWWNIWIYKNRMPTSEINQYIAYYKKLQKQAEQYKSHEEGLKKPRKEWLKYYDEVMAGYQKTIDIMREIIKTKISFRVVATGEHPDVVKKRKDLTKKLKKLSKDFRTAVLYRPSRPE